MANDLINLLPSGPRWSIQTITIDGYEPLEPIILYSRDAKECVEYLFNSPLFADRMNLVPVQHFTEDNKSVISEPISGRQAWKTQV